MASLTLRHLVPRTTQKYFGSSFPRKHSQCNPITLHPDVQSCLNAQINQELFASYSYLAMAAFFGRQNIALKGCQKFFKDQVEEEQEHANKFIDYVNRRGGYVQFAPVECPTNQDWATPLCAFKEALELERIVSEKLVQLHKVSVNCCDICSCNLIEAEFLEEQVTSIDKIARYVTQLEMMGDDGLGIQMFDNILLEEK